MLVVPEREGACGARTEGRLRCQSNKVLGGEERRRRKDGVDMREKNKHPTLRMWGIKIHVKFRAPLVKVTILDA